MAKEENKSGGLLSKVVRFVRHPTVNWSDLENLNQESEESQYSKQALKEMLERKRLNDFVR
jgi:FKBP-type peptidyl-prolyl cis-trans isomerase (trigger factor)